jgi:glucosamine-6-phosphate deaminase
VEVVILSGTDEIASVAAGVIVALLSRKSEAVVGLATGSSPLGVYTTLIERHRSGDVTFAGAQAFLLDEYVGLPAEHPQRYRSVIGEVFERHVDFAPGAVRGPDGNATDLLAACVRYEAAIAAAGGVDVQLLGIGTDGHIAFNEPGSSLTSRTRVKTLASQTRADNARFFDSESDVPRHVLTQGLGTISAARHLLLVATGAGKAAAVQAMVEGPVSAHCPASILQLHQHATVLLDDAAASSLDLGDYYRETYAHKPAWQGL